MCQQAFAALVPLILVVLAHKHDYPDEDACHQRAFENEKTYHAAHGPGIVELGKHTCNENDRQAEQYVKDDEGSEDFLVATVINCAIVIRLFLENIFETLAETQTVVYRLVVVIVHDLIDVSLLLSIYDVYHDTPFTRLHKVHRKRYDKGDAVEDVE